MFVGNDTLKQGQLAPLDLGKLGICGEQQIHALLVELCTDSNDTDSPYHSLFISRVHNSEPYNSKIAKICLTLWSKLFCVSPNSKQAK